MRVGRPIRLLARALAVVVLLVSGGYLLVYLVRWEWNRALVAGIFFVASEVAIVGWTILARLRGIEESVAAGGGRGAVPEHAQVIGEEDKGRARSFAWLRDTTGRAGVFIPVLLGAGVVLSAIAYLVERVAGAVAGHAVDGAMARRLALDLPSGGLVPGVGSTQRAVLRQQGRPMVAPPPTPVAAVGGIIVAAVLAAGAVVAVDALRDLTESRSQPEAEGVATLIELRVEERRTERPATQTAEALWVACRSTVHDHVELTGVQSTSGSIVELTLAPPLDELESLRLRGCLGDATLDLVRAQVVGFHTVDD